MHGAGRLLRALSLTIIPGPLARDEEASAEKNPLLTFMAPDWAGSHASDTTAAEFELGPYPHPPAPVTTPLAGIRNRDSFSSSSSSSSLASASSKLSSTSHSSRRRRQRPPSNIEEGPHSNSSALITPPPPPSVNLPHHKNQNSHTIWREYWH